MRERLMLLRDFEKISPHYYTIRVAKTGLLPLTYSYIMRHTIVMYDYGKHISVYICLCIYIFIYKHTFVSVKMSRSCVSMENACRDIFGDPTRETHVCTNNHFNSHLVPARLWIKKWEYRHLDSRRFLRCYFVPCCLCLIIHWGSLRVRGI